MVGKLCCALLVAGTASAQAPGWTKPFVADARFELRQGERARGKTLLPGQRIELEAGSTVLLEVQPLDQWGRPFPQELSAFGLLDTRGCRDLVELSQPTPTTLQLAAGTSRGRCELRLVALGNLNLEWSFPVEVTSVAKGGYTREQAEYIATHLYRALFDRQPDPEGFRAAVAEIQRDRLGSLLEGMLQSQEFREKWQGRPPTAFLEQVYRGLLGRPPDSEAVRRYLRDVERGKLKSVLAAIIHSEEFEANMARSLGSPSRF